MCVCMHTLACMRASRRVGERMREGGGGGRERESWKGQIQSNKAECRIICIIWRVKEICVKVKDGIEKHIMKHV